MANSINERHPILTIYNDGSMKRIDMNAGDLRNIGRQLVAMADGAMLPGTPQPMPPEIAEEMGSDS